MPFAPATHYVRTGSIPIRACLRDDGPCDIEAEPIDRGSRDFAWATEICKVGDPGHDLRTGITIDAHLKVLDPNTTWSRPRPPRHCAANVAGFRKLIGSRMDRDFRGHGPRSTGLAVATACPRWHHAGEEEQEDN